MRPPPSPTEDVPLDFVEDGPPIRATDLARSDCCDAFLDLGSPRCLYGFFSVVETFEKVCSEACSLVDG